MACLFAMPGAPLGARAPKAVVLVLLVLAAWSVLFGISSSPASAAARLGELTLRSGHSGPDVRELQRTLKRLRMQVSVDGAYGVGTRRAVRRYERRVRIAADGVVSPGQARGMRARAGTLAFGERTLREGHTGKDVRRLQQLLGGLGLATRADGRFGATTRRNVERYERGGGGGVDGRVTPAEAQTLLTAATTQAGSAGPGRAPAGAPATAPGRHPVAGRWTAGGAGTAFGERGGRHQGADVFAACGTPLVAPMAGTVRFVKYESDAGHYVVLHADATGEDHVLMHLRQKAIVAAGARVAVGQPIGEVGATGNADGCHLHFEIWTAPGWYRGGAPRDPAPDLRRWTG